MLADPEPVAHHPLPWLAPAPALSAGIVAETVLLASAAMAWLLFLPWAGFWLGLAIGPWHFAAAAAGTLGVAGARCRAGRPWPMVLCAVGLVLLMFAASLALAVAAYDVSYDGSAYHQVGVIALRDGWNPIAVPHVMDWSNAQWPDRRPWADRLADQGLWTDHFPKAAWVLGAVVSSAFDTLDGAKWSHGFMLFTAVLALQHGFRAAGIGRGWAVSMAVVGALSPVVVAQLHTNYVDGLLGCVLAVQAGAALAWLAERRGAWLVVMWAMLGVAANLKFTGLVYSGLLLLSTGAAAWLAGWRPRRIDASLIGAGCVGVLVVSGQTYGHNLLAHGHPFYPVATADVMKDQATASFLARGRIQKFVLASTQVPGLERGAETPHWVLPRLWHYSKLTQAYDVRMGGMGPLFIHSLALALLVAAGGVLLLARRRALRAGAAAVAGLLAWVLLSTAINPEFWWARYAPQLWWTVPLAAALALKAGSRTVAGAVLAPAAVVSAVMVLYWAQDTLTARAAFQDQLTELASRGVVTVPDTRSNDPMLYTFAQQVQARGGRVSLLPPGLYPTRRVGFVDVYETPR